MISLAVSNASGVCGFLSGLAMLGSGGCGEAFLGLWVPSGLVLGLQWWEQQVKHVYLLAPIWHSWVSVFVGPAVSILGPLCILFKCEQWHQWTWWVRWTLGPCAACMAWAMIVVMDPQAVLAKVINNCDCDRLTALDLRLPADSYRWVLELVLAVDHEGIYKGSKNEWIDDSGGGLGRVIPSPQAMRSAIEGGEWQACQAYLQVSQWYAWAKAVINRRWWSMVVTGESLSSGCIQMCSNPVADSGVEDLSVDVAPCIRWLSGSGECVLQPSVVMAAIAVCRKSLSFGYVLCTVPVVWGIGWQSVRVAPGRVVVFRFCPSGECMLWFICSYR